MKVLEISLNNGQIIAIDNPKITAEALRDKMHEIGTLKLAMKDKGIVLLRTQDISSFCIFEQEEKHG